MIDPTIRAHYELEPEKPRLSQQSRLEWVRTQELLSRYLPAPSASVLDVGGGPGVYSGWLAEKGYRVHLIDPVPLHVSQAHALAEAQPMNGFTAELGDARRLPVAEATFDAVLLMGPLYHLVEQSDRLLALREARGALRPGGLLIAVGISRFASLLDGLRSNWLADPIFREIVEQDLRTGQHRNPEPERRPEWFTTAYFHRPEELAEEVQAAGFAVQAVVGIEGPGWILSRQLWDDVSRRAQLLDAARLAEQEPSLTGASAHLMVVAQRV